MNRSIVSLSLVLCFASGCSTAPTNNAEGGFEYAKVKEGKPLTIPNNLVTPKAQDEYEIPATETSGDIAEQLDIRSPSLVLPVAASSRLEQHSSDAIVWFDQVLDDKALYPFLLEAVKDQLASNTVELVSLNEANKTFQSTWFSSKTETDNWLLSDVTELERAKFNFYFDVKPHGRSVGLRVELAGFEKSNEQGNSKDIGLVDKQRAEMNMLNSIIAHVGYKYRTHIHEQRLLRSNQKLVSIDNNVKAEPSFIVEMDLEALWSNMPSFFESHGFKVTDLNEPKKTYYVDFEQLSNSIWSSLWGDEVPVIDIEDGQYLFTLREHGDEALQTAVTIYDQAGTPLPQATLEKIFLAIEPGLSFREQF